MAKKGTAPKETTTGQRENVSRALKVMQELMTTRGVHWGFVALDLRGNQPYVRILGANGKIKGKNWLVLFTTAPPAVRAKRLRVMAEELPGQLFMDEEV